MRHVTIFRKCDVSCMPTARLWYESCLIDPTNIIEPKITPKTITPPFIDRKAIMNSFSSYFLHTAKKWIQMPPPRGRRASCRLPEPRIGGSPRRQHNPNTRPRHESEATLNIRVIKHKSSSETRHGVMFVGFLCEIIGSVVSRLVGRMEWIRLIKIGIKLKTVKRSKVLLKYY
jgi:hypothetical protein